VSPTTPRGRLAALLAAAATAASLPLTLGAGAEAAPSKPAKPAPQAPGQQPIKLDLLAINDFHGQLEKAPASSSTGRVATRTGNVAAGGAAYLATHLDQLRQGAAARGASTITVAAGDLIGATPLLSAAFHDEPTVEAMNALGLDVASVGNHEFDEGYHELLRMQDGGCLPDGDGKDNQNSCPDPQRPFTGADYQYLSANVKYAGTDRTVFPAYVVKKVGPAKVGFIGLTLKDTPNIVTKAGVEGLEFTDEVATVNALVPELRAQGVRSIVVLLHQGGTPGDATDYNGCGGAKGVTGPGIELAKAFDPAVDVVVEGHTHQAYNCVVQDPAGNPRRVTSAGHVGRLVTDLQLRIDPRTKDVIRPSVKADNVIVTNDDGTAARSDIVDLISRYSTLVAPIANEVLGHLAPASQGGDVLAKPSPIDRDFPLGNLIADSQLADTSHHGGRPAATIAFMNPGGIRTSLVENAAGEVTYGAAFAVQPFNNYLVSEDLTGQQVLNALNDQWNGKNEASRIILQVSGLSYRYSSALAAQGGTTNALVGDVLVDTDRDGVADTPIDPAATYRVVLNAFLADGGDGFPSLVGADKYFGGLDIDALATYLAGHDPYDPASVPQSRVTVIP
jgi:5'-nucleotidase